VSFSYLLNVSYLCISVKLNCSLVLDIIILIDLVNIYSIPNSVIHSFIHHSSFILFIVMLLLIIIFIINQLVVVLDSYDNTHKIITTQYNPSYHQSFRCVHGFSEVSHCLAPLGALDWFFE
jgi:hypothetical protein